MYCNQRSLLRTVLPLCITAFLVLPFILSAEEPGVKKAQISIPGVTGMLEMNVGPTTWQQRVRPDGRETQMQAMNRPDGLRVTAFLQKVNFEASPEKCRSEWWPGTRDAVKIQRNDMEDSVVKDGIARVEFIIPEFQGAEVRQKNVHAYLGSRNLCAEIHLSKVAFQPGDQKLFEDLLATVRLSTDDSATERPAAISLTTKYMGDASVQYAQHNYSVAAPLYQKALDLEKQNRTLNKVMFRVLVDNLGMSYGISGNLADAKKTFEYGITQDAEYPMFYYNMACT